MDENLKENNNVKKYIIGIDGGSQSTKVVMYDLQGNVVCEGKGLLQPMHTPDADTAEHPDDDLWTSYCAGKDLMSPVRPERGYCRHRSRLYPLLPRAA
jgi:glycerol kinase